MRCFIAIEIDAAVRERLAAAQDDLRPHVSGVSWTKPDNIHLTLKFLGEIEDKRANRAMRVLTELALRLTGGNVESKGVGCFPNLKNPRVIWAGLADEAGLLHSTAQAIEGELSKIGFPRERRPFRAHLTLGRVRESFRAPDFPNQLARNGNRPFGPTVVRELTFFQSRLDPKGSIYTPLGRFPLQRNPG
ncbi:MAG: RNA 2',3'-cyclic phosphodiesterase [Nitrospirae bacterium]|nr:RNA 2',3'-cyclic phosphodiesterase [Nitrospirota bacterium]